jgi:hypothetical protein
MNDLDNSRPLDVHVWSDYPELNHLIDALWRNLFNNQDVQKRGPKPKTPKKDHLKVLLLDLYVCWLNDPKMYLAVHMSKSGWNANCRYNTLHLSSQMISIIHRLKDFNYLEFHKGYPGKLTRIRPHANLRILFENIGLPLSAVSFHHKQEVLVLHGESTSKKSSTKPELEYTDNDKTIKMRSVLLEYNKLLTQSRLDIFSLENSYVDSLCKKGKRTGETVRVHIDHRNIFVKRVFNKSSWELGGRFYGGWWQQINKELRADIMINDQPTIEIDYKAMHVNLLMAQINQRSDYDPYNLGKSVFPHRNDFDQRIAVKQLVLMAINACDKATAFSAFRSDQAKGHPSKKLNNVELSQLLDAFIEKYPRLEPFLCKGKGLELMYLDSCLAEYVIKKLTKMAIPVLCIHDSFIVGYSARDHLSLAMQEAGDKIVNRFLDFEYDKNSVIDWFKEFNEHKMAPNFQLKKIKRSSGYIQRMGLNPYDDFDEWIQ